MPNVDTDWKAKLKEAEQLASTAYAQRKVAEEVFLAEMKKVDVLVKEAIKAGGADAEKQWTAFITDMRETFEKFRKEVEQFVDEMHAKLKAWGKVVNWVKNKWYFIGGAVIVLLLLGKLFKWF